MCFLPHWQTICEWQWGNHIITLSDGQIVALHLRCALGAPLGSTLGLQQKQAEVFWKIVIPDWYSLCAFVWYVSSVHIPYPIEKP